MVFVPNRYQHLHLPLARFAIPMLIFATFTGCQEKQEVRVYHAPKHKFEDPQRRMLAAVIPHGSSVFYLKVADLPKKLDSLVSPFEEVVRKVTFSPTGQPIWNLPEGWRELPGSGMSMALLEAPLEGKPVSIAVTKLDMPPDGWERYLEDNLNRWRGQYSLPRQSLEEQKQSLKEVQREGGEKSSYVVDLVGIPANPMGGPMMSQAPPQTPPPEPSSMESPFEYDVPSDWKKSAKRQFTLDAFEISNGNGRGEVTVTVAAMSDLKQNAEMWQSQVMKDADPARLAKGVEQALTGAAEIKSTLGKAKVYEFQDADASDGPALLIAIVTIDGFEAQIYTKLKGDRAIVTSQRDNLIRFVESTRVKK